MASTKSSWFIALGSGLAGALATTLINEIGRRSFRTAPQLDTLGRRAIVSTLRGLEMKPPSGNRLQQWALAGDLVFNSLYFGLAGAKPRSWSCGPLLGLGAGIGAVTLPPTFGLGCWPTRRTPATKMMTIGWYIVGGVAASATARLLAECTRATEAE